MARLDKERIERKLGFLNRYLLDLRAYAGLDGAGRRREHYAVERLLQLLCESAADIALQLVKARGETLPASYREVFSALERAGVIAGWLLSFTLSFDDLVIASFVTGPGSTTLPSTCVV